MNILTEDQRTEVGEIVRKILKEKKDADDWVRVGRWREERREKIEGDKADWLFLKRAFVPVVLGVILMAFCFKPELFF